MKVKNSKEAYYAKIIKKLLTKNKLGQTQIFLNLDKFIKEFKFDLTTDEIIELKQLLKEKGYFKNNENLEMKK